MSKDQVKALVGSIATGKNQSNIRDLLEQAVRDKASGALEIKKISVAKGFFGQKDE